jgi:DNA-directed RNA polymerase specialized sigma24 family protein
MKSIASHLPEKYGGEEFNVPMRGSDFAPPQDEESFADPIQNLGVEAPSLEDELAARRALDRLERLFEDDEEAFNVLVLLSEGRSESEIAKELSSPGNKVHAAIQRIRSKIAKVNKDSYG